MERGFGVLEAGAARLHDKAKELYQTSIRMSEPCQIQVSGTSNIMFSLSG
jgi:hypothetical protein